MDHTYSNTGHTFAGSFGGRHAVPGREVWLPAAAARDAAAGGAGARGGAARAPVHRAAEGPEALAR